MMNATYYQTQLEGVRHMGFREAWDGLARHRRSGHMAFPTGGYIHKKLRSFEGSGHMAISVQTP